MDSINRLELDVAERRVDPFLMSVLKSRFEAIVREMTLVVMRASRSAVIKNARDFSCAILTYDHRLVSVEDALPIHVMSMDMATRPLTELKIDHTYVEVPEAEHSMAPLAAAIKDSSLVFAAKHFTLPAEAGK